MDMTGFTAERRANWFLLDLDWIYGAISIGLADSDTYANGFGIWTALQGLESSHMDRQRGVPGALERILDAPGAWIDRPKILCFFVDLAAWAWLKDITFNLWEWLVLDVIDLVAVSCLGIIQMITLSSRLCVRANASPRTRSRPFLVL